MGWRDEIQDESSVPQKASSWRDNLEQDPQYGALDSLKTNYEKYALAPLRAGYSELHKAAQPGSNEGMLHALGRGFIGQFGKDPSSAPSQEALGADMTPFKETGTGRGGATKEMINKGARGLVGLVTSPSSYFLGPLGEVAAAEGTEALSTARAAKAAEQAKAALDPMSQMLSGQLPKEASKIGGLLKNTAKEVGEFALDTLPMKPGVRYGLRKAIKYGPGVIDAFKRGLIK